MDKVALSAEEIPVQVTEPSKKISYKTKLWFNDLQRGKKEHVSVCVPQVTNWGGLQFTMEDRVVVYPIGAIFSWETEKLQEVTEPKLVI